MFTDGNRAVLATRFRLPILVVLGFGAPILLCRAQDVSSQEEPRPSSLAQFAMRTGGSSTLAPEPGPDRTGVEKLIRRYYVEIAAEPDEAKSGKAADEILDQDILFTFGTRPVVTQGIADYKRWLKWHHTAGKDQVWTSQDLIVEKDLAAIRFHLTVTHAAEFLGVPPNGRRITIRGMYLCRLSAERVVELYRVFDVCDVLHQMGAACPPTLKATSEPSPNATPPQK